MGIGSLAHQRMSPTPGEEDQLIGIEWEGWTPLRAFSGPSVDLLADSVESCQRVARFAVVYLRS